MVKDQQDTYNVFGFKKRIRANITIINGSSKQRYDNKEVEIFEGARGIRFYRIDNNLYPVRYFRDGEGYQVEKKYPNSIAFFVPVVFILWYLQTVYMFHLMTGEDYFNVVTVITMFMLAGAFFYVARTLTREMVNVIYLVKNKFVWDYVDIDDYLQPNRYDLGRTQIIYKGFGGGAIYSALIFGFIAAFVINLLIFRVKDLPLLTNSYEQNGWIVMNSATAQKIVYDFSRTLDVLNMMVYVGVATGILLLLLGFLATLVIMKNPRQDVPMTYMGDMVNYDPEKKVFRLVDYYFNPFENPQL
ncbi:MAG: hypothetical protein ACTSRR_09885, partial [Candidatus Heimdallarchaeaceae archaeon]